MSGGASSTPAILQKMLALGTFLVGVLSFWSSSKKSDTCKMPVPVLAAKPRAQSFGVSINNLPRPSELPVPRLEESSR